MKELSGKFMNEDKNLFQRTSLMKYLETAVVFEKNNIHKARTNPLLWRLIIAQILKRKLNSN